MGKNIGLLFGSIILLFIAVTLFYFGYQRVSVGSSQVINGYEHATQHTLPQTEHYTQVGLMYIMFAFLITTGVAIVGLIRTKSKS